MSGDGVFMPIGCRSTIVPSRLVFAPINTGFARAYRPTARLIRFQCARSSTAVGINMVGNVAIDRDSVSNPNTVVLDRPSGVPRLALLAERIRAGGSIPGIQLASCPEDLSPPRSWRPRDVFAERDRLRAMVTSWSDARIELELKRFVEAVRLARVCGFGVIQIHAAHGYTLGLLLTPDINRRHGRFALEAGWVPSFIGELRSAACDVPLSIRLSAISGIRAGEMEVEWTRDLADSVVRSGIDIVDYSAGLYTLSRRLIYPGREHAAPVYSEYIDRLVPTDSCLIVVAGRILDPVGTCAALPPNVLVAIGRPLIADPHYALKLRAGEMNAIRVCRLTNRCHYFSRGVPSLECGVNPDL